MHRIAFLVGLSLCVAGCKGKVRTIDQLASALSARGMVVATRELTPDEALVMAKFKAFATQFGTTKGEEWDETRELNVDGIAIQVTHYGGVLSARAALKDSIAQEAETAKVSGRLKSTNYPPHLFSNGAFVFEVMHARYSASPGGKHDMSGPREIKNDPAEEARVEQALKALKLGVF
jgi:hypothetical protein